MSSTKAEPGRELAHETVRDPTGRAWDEWEALLDSRGATDLLQRLAS
jgi:hypothetical protein